MWLRPWSTGGDRGPRADASSYRHSRSEGFVDHTRYDTTSILKLIEERWGLTALNARDAGAGDLVNALDLALQTAVS